MDIHTMLETQPALDLSRIERTTFINNRTNAVYAQDQIDVRPDLKVNVGLRLDNYDRSVDRTGGFPFTPQRLSANAATYRAGVVYAPRADQQVYAGVASSFTPIIDVPENGEQLEPTDGRSLEIGHRWQAEGGRVVTNAALYWISRNHVTFLESPVSVRQIGEQTSRGLDLDVNADLGHQTSLIFNYGSARGRFDDAEELTGLVPKYVPAHTANLWVRKDWPNGWNGAIGLRAIGGQFADDSNTTRLDAYGIVALAAGYRTGRWEWSVNIDNLFDHDGYFLPGHFSNLAFPGSPFQLSTGVRLRY
jgi:outer membrane receptor protein involved in Fe transport